MAARKRYCNWCGEQILPSESSRFDTLDREAIYHDPCFWGVASRRGWSYLQRWGMHPPRKMLFSCARCDVELVTDRDEVWYEKEGEYYRPYHPACAPSRIP